MSEELHFRRENAIANLGRIEMWVVQDEEDNQQYEVSFRLRLPDGSNQAESLALLIHTVTEAIVSFDETFEVKS